MESEKISAKQKLQEVRKSLANLTEQETAKLKLAATIATVEGHTLSPINTRLLYIQAGARGITPTIVGGYRQWQKAGKQVRKGEHGFSISIPGGVRQSEDGYQDDDNIFFLAATVFDVSQVEERQMVAA